MNLKTIDGILILIFFIMSILPIMYSYSNMFSKDTPHYENINVKKYMNNSPKTENFPELFSKIELIDGEQDIEKIKNILEKTDEKVLKKIKFIRVHHTKNIPTLIAANGEKNVVGTAWRTYAGENRLLYAEIHIIASNFYTSNSTLTFDEVLLHEIGHVYGGAISRKLGSSEKFAENYSHGNIDIPTNYSDTLFIIISIIISVILSYLLGNI